MTTLLATLLALSSTLLILLLWLLDVPEFLVETVRDRRYYANKPAEYWVEVEQELEKCEAAMNKVYDKLDIYAGPEYVQQRAYLDLLFEEECDLVNKLSYKPKELTSDND